MRGCKPAEARPMEDPLEPASCQMRHAAFPVRHSQRRPHCFKLSPSTDLTLSCRRLMLCNALPLRPLAIDPRNSRGISDIGHQPQQHHTPSSSTGIVLVRARPEQAMLQALLLQSVPTTILPGHPSRAPVSAEPLSSPPSDRRSRPVGSLHSQPSDIFSDVPACCVST